MSRLDRFFGHIFRGAIAFVIGMAFFALLDIRNDVREIRQSCIVGEEL